MFKNKGSLRFDRMVFFNLLFIAATNTTSAQLSIGLETGYNKNYLYTNTSNRDFTAYKPAGGFNLGIPLSYTVSSWFAVQADPSLIKKNYRTERSDFFEGVYQVNTNTYLQLPVMGHFTFGGQYLKGFLNLGVYGGYWTLGKVKGTLPNILNAVDTVGNINTVYDYQKSYNYNEKYLFDSRKDNRIEFGWLAGVGLSYDLNNVYQVFGEARYYQSLTDQQKKYMINQVPRYNQTYIVTVGVLINLKNLTQGNAF